MLTASQVDKAFDDDREYPGVRWSSFEYGDQYGSIEVGRTWYDYEVLDTKYGEEGDWATQTFVVIKVGEQVFRKTGHYRSHDGEYWDGPCMEVAPVEKTVTVWEDKPAPANTYGDFTADDVEAAINDDDNLYWGEMGYGSETVTIKGYEYNTEPVKDIGGEGQGEYAAAIFKIGERMFRKEGYYASHYGTDWDGDFSEVEPYEKVVTDYKPI